MLQHPEPAGPLWPPPRRDAAVRSGPLPTPATAAAAATAAAGHKYAKCLAGGVLASSIRLITNPLEVVKGYSQVGRYAPETGVLLGLRTLWLEEGLGGLFKGVGPTAVAYAIQTGTKYSLYEFLKDAAADRLGPDYRARQHYRQLVYVAAAGLAEACADVLMCPWEQLRVRVQTSPRGDFPTRLRPAWARLVATGARPLFRPLPALWLRQVPATVTNFFVFENAVRAAYRHILRCPRDACAKPTQLGVSLAAGFVSGVCCAVVSHPADSLVSLLAQPQHRDKGLRRLVAEVGLVRLGTLGLAPRMLLCGTIVGSQWILYDTFKTAMGMSTSGSDGSE